jgi:hypothetical protein
MITLVKSRTRMPPSGPSAGAVSLAIYLLLSSAAQSRGPLSICSAAGPRQFNALIAKGSIDFDSAGASITYAIVSTKLAFDASAAVKDTFSKCDNKKWSER